jgi:urea transport system substrate-binding protein
MKYYVRLAGLVVAALLLLGPLTAQTQQTIKIGVVAGLEIANGRDTLRGAQLAADEINAAGGVMGRKIELVVGDMKTEGDGELARRVYQDIASRSDAVVGVLPLGGRARGASRHPAHEEAPLNHGSDVSGYRSGALKL